MLERWTERASDLEEEKKENLFSADMSVRSILSTTKKEEEGERDQSVECLNFCTFPYSSSNQINRLLLEKLIDLALDLRRR